MMLGLNEEMLDKEYRHGLVGAQFDIDLPLQLRALRKERGWTQPELAIKAEMKQPRISAMERPGGANFTLETLRRLAKAFDVALIVRFAPFSELLRWSERFDPDNFTVPSFPNDPGLIDKKPIANEETIRLSESRPTSDPLSFGLAVGAAIRSDKVVVMKPTGTFNGRLPDFRTEELRSNAG